MFACFYLVPSLSVDLVVLAHSHLCVRACVYVRVCFHLCVSVCVCASALSPISGSFGLFTSSNGTSKEDFSEFDSLRSSSSVPTGTHPCLCLAVDMEVRVVSPSPPPSPPAASVCETSPPFADAILLFCPSSAAGGTDEHKRAHV